MEAGNQPGFLKNLGIWGKLPECCNPTLPAGQIMLVCKVNVWSLVPHAALQPYLQAWCGLRYELGYNYALISKGTKDVLTGHNYSEKCLHPFRKNLNLFPESVIQWLESHGLHATSGLPVILCQLARSYVIPTGIQPVWGYLTICISPTICELGRLWDYTKHESYETT